jgi:hypothetical protein
MLEASSSQINQDAFLSVMQINSAPNFFKYWRHIKHMAQKTEG